MQEQITMLKGILILTILSLILLFFSDKYSTNYLAIVQGVFSGSIVSLIMTIISYLTFQNKMFNFIYKEISILYGDLLILSEKKNMYLKNNKEVIPEIILDKIKNLSYETNFECFLLNFFKTTLQKKHFKLIHDINEFLYIISNISLRMKSKEIKLEKAKVELEKACSELSSNLTMFYNQKWIFASKSINSSRDAQNSKNIY